MCENIFHHNQKIKPPNFIIMVKMWLLLAELFSAARKEVPFVLAFGSGRRNGTPLRLANNKAYAQPP